MQRGAEPRSKGICTKGKRDIKMFGLGTIINVTGVIVGGIIGLFAGRFISESLQDTMMKVCGVASMFIGLSGCLQKMLYVGGEGTMQCQGTMLMILSLVIGGVVGELCRLEQYVEQFGAWLKIKSGNAKDAKFIDAFVTASLTICIGAMAIVGAIEDGIMGDFSILFAKAVLDFIIIMVMASSMGKGCIFAALPVGVFQGSITLFAHFAGSVASEAAMNSISLVGGVLIFCIGVNIVWGKVFKVANLLPALIVAVTMTHFGWGW